MIQQEEQPWRTDFARKTAARLGGFLVLEGKNLLDRGPRVVEITSAAKCIGPNTRVLVERVETAARELRANKLTQAIRVLHAHLTSQDAILVDENLARNPPPRPAPARRQRGQRKPRYAPHQFQNAPRSLSA